MTLTTYDEALCRKTEQNVCTTRARFEVLKKMQDAGIPTVVWLPPVLPFINDTGENISGILDLCIEAGVYGIICFGMGLTLRDGNRYMIDSDKNGYLMKLFHKKCADNRIAHDNGQILAYLHTFEEKQSGRQLILWDASRQEPPQPPF